MITRMDEQIGALLLKLKELKLDEKTIVMFSSDNGPHKEGGNDPEFFDANGPLSGYKRSLTDGGIRVPYIVRAPGRVAAGVTSKHVGYFGDIFATLGEFAGVQPISGLDSISLLPVLSGRESQQKQHDYFYWEFYEGGTSQAVLLDGRWKGIRLKSSSAPIQLYDLTSDVAEQHDVAAMQPKLVARIAELMTTARRDNEHWKLADAAGRAVKRKWNSAQ
jgi:arylsulfatase A-like enzyme